MSRELNPSMLEKRIYNLEKNGGGGGEIEHLTEIIESVDNSLITEVDGVQTHFYLDYKDGKFGMNTEEERGADTFHPFNAGGSLVREIATNTTNQDLNVTFENLTEVDIIFMYYVFGGYRHCFYWDKDEDVVYLDGVIDSRFSVTFENGVFTVNNSRDGNTWSITAFAYGK